MQTMRTRERFHQILTEATRLEITDIILASGKRPYYCFADKIMDVNGLPLSDEDVTDIATIITGRPLDELLDISTLEVSYRLPNTSNRYRASVYRVDDEFRAVIRVIPTKIPTIDKLYLPEQIGELSALRRGLILVSGAPGQGKSTTIASLIDKINHSREAHIITIEDPIEFKFTDERAIISQRQVGIDVEDYKTGLRQAFRMRPDVLMVGEIRDRETFEAVLVAAESGFLSISAIHASDVMSTLRRIFSFYPEEERTELRWRLANNLKAIISQRLLLCEADEPERIPAIEFMRVNDAIVKCILDDRLEEIPEQMEKGKDYGMQLFEEHLFKLYQEGLIELDTALSSVTSVEQFNRLKMLEGME